MSSKSGGVSPTLKPSADNMARKSVPLSACAGVATASDIDMTAATNIPIRAFGMTAP